MDTFPIHLSLPSFLIIVLVFFMPAFSSAQEDNQTSCLPTPYECGEVRLDISYPFWIEDRPHNCSHGKEIKLTCNQTDGSSAIEIQEQQYHVMTIDYEKQTATIVDKDYYLANKGIIPRPCDLLPASNHSLGLNLFYYTLGDRNVSYLYNCPPDLPQDVLFFRLPNCSSDDLSDHAYNFTFEEYITGPVINCSVIKIPILHRNKERLLNNPEKFWDVLAGGFEVMWSLTQLDPYCRDCFESKGHCSFPLTYPSKRACYCNGTPYADKCPLPPAQSPGKHLVSSSLFLIMTSELKQTDPA